MSILAAATQKLLQLPAIQLPKWPGFTLGKRVSDATEAYAKAANDNHGEFARVA